MERFLTAYELAGIPFSLEYLLVGIGAVMTVRFTSSFLVGWLRAVLQNGYDLAAALSLFVLMNVGFA